MHDLSRGWTFPRDDAKPIVPDPPPPRSTYQGPGGSVDL
jgi:hypothetical protein